MNSELGFGRRVLSALEDFGVSFEHMPTGIDTMSVVVSDKELLTRKEQIIQRIEQLCQPDTISITLIDRGIPYNPLEKPDPDVTLSAEERQIGGLGIYMVKKSMDEMLYRHEDGQNILTMKKSWAG